MSREEDLIRSTTRAIASAVHEVPPFRLETAGDEFGYPEYVRRPVVDADPGRVRRWQSWLVPATAAAVVAALAIALAGVRSITNGGADNATSTGPSIPSSVPRYFAAIAQDMNSIVVGETRTGKALKTFAAPAHTVFASVTASADDRTFVVCAMTSATLPSGTPPHNVTQIGFWYEVRLAPGTADPVRLTRLPIKTQTVAVTLTATMAFGSALSASGQELAVSEWASSRFAVKVFSVATGRLLRDWATDDRSYAARPSLAWIDGDRKIALVNRVTDLQRNTNRVLSSGVTVREWPVAGPASGDLAADSKLVWELQTKKPVNGSQPCLVPLSRPLLVNPDGKTFSCVTASTSAAGERLSFRTYPLAASTTATAKGMIDYQVTRRNERAFPYSPVVLWSSPSGDTLIGAWWPATSANPDDRHVGVISHGTFTPLKIPASVDATTVTAIAF
jgi:hypothetical protein